MTNETPLSSHPPQALRPFSGEARFPMKLLFSVRRHVESIDFSFVLSARVAADLSRLVLPEMIEPRARRRRDELWKNSCLEIFVGSAADSSYVELNLSPCGDWNVYGFDGYRQGMRAVSEVEPPLVQVERAPAGDSVLYQACLRAPRGGGGPVADLLKSRALVMGATAVLEYGSGEREYWALAHAGDKPDFHLRESFRLPL